MNNLYWAAGLFEGEGTITLNRQGKYAYPRVALVMGDQDIVERFNSVMGMGKLVIETRDNRPAHHKAMYRWQVQNRKDFAAFVEKMEPLLGPRRQLQIARVLEEMSPVLRNVPSASLLSGKRLGA